MPDEKVDSISYSHSDHFENRDIQQEFNAWNAPSARLQISAVCFLTGILYVIYSQLDSIAAPAELRPMMTTIHLYIIAPVLFLISLLSFWKNFPTLTLTMLILAPIGAAIGNLFIVVNIESPATYLTELYLILFWTFTVSGLQLAQATISAVGTFIIVSITTYFLFPLPRELLIMHFFWMLSAFSFGFLGAYLLEESNRRVFLNHGQ
ncbi:MAG: hypothetical protein MUP09_02230, partial [Thiovulaceae bacterium]|nr:hypothetical protein [Sulfurimonadaceae bacterium]